MNIPPLHIDPVTLDAVGMRVRNRTLMLQLLWHESGISRADLARRTGMSRSAVSAIVSELLATGLVTESGTGVSRGGRRPILLRFREDAAYIAGIDMGASHLACALTDLRGRVVDWRHADFDVRADPEGTLEWIHTQVRAAMSGLGIGIHRLAGLGVAVPSPVDLDSPGQLAARILPAWTDIDLQAELSARFDVPVLIDNDANLGAVAERWWGAGRQAANLVYLKIGTGVGSGHIIDGQLHRGRRGGAGEIGHVVVQPGAELCNCGMRGCLYTAVGAQGLLDSVARHAPAFPDASWARSPTLDGFYDAARFDDPLAHRVLADAGAALGTAIVGLLNLLSPDVIVLSGRIVEAGTRITDPVRAFVRQHAFWPAMAETPIVVSELGERGVALGASTEVLQSLLKDPSLFPEPQLASPA